MASSIKHILVIRLSALGDVAMTVPVIRVLKTTYPELQLTILTRKHFAPLFQGLEGVSIFNADVKGKHKGLIGLKSLAKELKTLNIDAVADLHNVLRSNVLKVFLSTIKFVQIDKGRADKKALVTGREFQQLKSTHQRYADVFSKLGFEIDFNEHKFPQSRELNTNVLNIINSASKDLIGIAPFAAFKGKMYPLHLMEIVIQELSKSHHILLFGGGEEESLKLQSFENNINNVTSLAGKMNLNEELDVISNLKLMIAMDSANAHLAALFGIKTLTIWGVTHPFAGFAPFGQPEEHMLLADRQKYPHIPTSVYGKTIPKGYENVMETITPEAILAKAKTILQA